MHEMQVPGLLPLQRLFLQSVFILQCFRSAHLGQAGPPQSMSVSCPFCTPSVQVDAAQTFDLHTLSTQSLAILHALPSAHGAHTEPPQSTSVSSRSLIPSVQCATTQLPMPSQTLPEPQAVFAATGVLRHVWLAASHVGVAHSPTDGHCDALLHATQLPLPSHTAPPLSWQAVSFAAFMVVQAPAEQPFVRHFVVGSGQLSAVTHATQLPLPSHTVPPLFEQDAPAIAFIDAQQPMVQVPMAHEDEGQSVLAVQAMPPSHTSMPPAPLLAVVGLPPCDPVLVEALEPPCPDA
jgi:hypothetical protein